MKDYVLKFKQPSYKKIPLPKTFKNKQAFLYTVAPLGAHLNSKTWGVTWV